MGFQNLGPDTCPTARLCGQGEGSRAAAAGCAVDSKRQTEGHEAISWRPSQALQSAWDALANAGTKGVHFFDESLAWAKARLPRRCNQEPSSGGW